MIIDFHAHLYNRDWLPQKFWKGMVNRAVAVRKRGGDEGSPEAIEKVIFSRFEDPTGEVLVQEMKEWGKMIRNLPENAPPGIRFSPEEIDNILFKNALRVMKIKEIKELEP